MSCEDEFLKGDVKTVSGPLPALAAQMLSQEQVTMQEIPDGLKDSLRTALQGIIREETDAPQLFRAAINGLLKHFQESVVKPVAARVARQWPRVDPHALLEEGDNKLDRSLSRYQPLQGGGDPQPLSVWVRTWVWRGLMDFARRESQKQVPTPLPPTPPEQPWEPVIREEERSIATDLLRTIAQFLSAAGGEPLQGVRPEWGHVLGAALAGIKPSESARQREENPTTFRSLKYRLMKFLQGAFVRYRTRVLQPGAKGAAIPATPDEVALLSLDKVFDTEDQYNEKLVGLGRKSPQTIIVIEGSDGVVGYFSAFWVTKHFIDEMVRRGPNIEELGVERIVVPGNQWPQEGLYLYLDAIAVEGSSLAWAAPVLALIWATVRQYLPLLREGKVLGLVTVAVTSQGARLARAFGMAPMDRQDRAPKPPRILFRVDTATVLKAFSQATGSETA